MQQDIPERHARLPERIIYYQRPLKRSPRPCKITQQALCPSQKHQVHGVGRFILRGSLKMHGCGAGISLSNQHLPERIVRWCKPRVARQQRSARGLGLVHLSAAKHLGNLTKRGFQRAHARSIACPKHSGHSSVRERRWIKHIRQ